MYCWGASGVSHTWYSNFNRTSAEYYTNKSNKESFFKYKYYRVIIMIGHDQIFGLSRYDSHRIIPLSFDNYKCVKQDNVLMDDFILSAVLKIPYNFKN